MKKNIKDITTLVVDDNEIDRSILKAMLTKLGFKNIIEAEDGGVAEFKIFNHISASHEMYDLILLDMEIPKHSGLKILQNIRKRPEFNSAKIIVVTGHSEKQLVEEALLSGANGYLIKPTNLDALKSQIFKVLDVE